MKKVYTDCNQSRVFSSGFRGGGSVVPAFVPRGKSGHAKE